jgi:hypothetical protein
MLMITALSTLSLAGIIPNHDINMFIVDELDQESTQVNTATAIGASDKELAQSFTPTLPTLTRVILRLKLDGVADFYKYYVDIKESYLGSALTSAFVDRSEFVTGTNFIEFDFPDISVKTGNKYFIIVRGVSDSGDSGKVYWWYGYSNPYAGGDAWYESISGWNYLQEGILRCDFCFQTYGMYNQIPNNPVCSYDRISDELIITATDPDDDQIKYGVDWNNDLIIDQWTSLVASGTEQRIDCGGRTGTVGVLAEDENGAQSDFVSLKSKNEFIEKLFFNDLFDRFIYSFSLFEKILKGII